MNALNSANFDDCLMAQLDLFFQKKIAEKNFYSS